MMKYLIAAIGIALLALVAYQFLGKGSTPPQTATSTPPQTQQIATSTYATTTFSVVYPTNFVADPNYSYAFNDTKSISGVKFTIPMTMATGTNLSADSYISVESLPRAQTCTADIYILDNVRSTKMSEGTAMYSVASTSGAGAGNFYEEIVYARDGSKPCIAVRYYIHSTNIGNYPVGAVREFDKAKLLSAFDDIRRSLQLNTVTP